MTHLIPALFLMLTCSLAGQAMAQTEEPTPEEVADVKMSIDVLENRQETLPMRQTNPKILEAAAKAVAGDCPVGTTRDPALIKIGTASGTFTLTGDRSAGFTVKLGNASVFYPGPIKGNRFYNSAGLMLSVDLPPNTRTNMEGEIVDPTRQFNANRPDGTILSLVIHSTGGERLSVLSRWDNGKLVDKFPSQKLDTQTFSPTCL